MDDKPNSDHFHYKVRSFRLDEKTMHNLKRFKNKMGKSWNLVFTYLLKHSSGKSSPEDLRKIDTE